MNSDICRKIEELIVNRDGVIRSFLESKPDNFSFSIWEASDEGSGTVWVVETQKGDDFETVFGALLLNFVAFSYDEFWLETSPKPEGFGERIFDKCWLPELLSIRLIDAKIQNVMRQMNNNISNINKSNQGQIKDIHVQGNSIDKRKNFVKYPFETEIKQAVSLRQEWNHVMFFIETQTSYAIYGWMTSA